MNVSSVKEPAWSMDLPPERRLVLQRLFKRLSAFQSLPSTGQQILSLTERGTSSPDELRAVIQCDPVLVARIFRRLNSPYFGLSQKVMDIKTALELLGDREIRNLALTIFVSKFYEAEGDHHKYRREGLWSHSVSVGAAARLVSRVCGKAAPEEAYLAGLLHDIGLIVIDQTLRKHFCQMLDALTPDVRTCDVEHRILSFDHAALGGFIAQEWNFPDPVADAITFHHQPDLYRGKNVELVDVVAVANYLCSRAGRTSLGVHNVATPSDETFARLDLDQVTLAIIWDELESTLEKADLLAAD